MIFDFLKNGFREISNSLDLSFEDDSVADEKISFLAYLASVLKKSSFFPYEPPAGSKRFRNLISGFMKTYHHVPINADVSELRWSILSFNALWLVIQLLQSFYFVDSVLFGSLFKLC